MALGKNVTIDELIEKVKRVKTYISSSNGGVTVSGGEPLLQAKALIPFFQKLKKMKIHTCIDTSRICSFIRRYKRAIVFNRFSFTRYKAYR